MTEDTTTETGTPDYDAEFEEEWLDEPQELPRRPRRKLLSPVPIALLVVLLVAGAFFAGVEVEKNQASSSSSGGLSSGLSALRSRLRSAGATSSASPAGSSGAAGFPTGGKGFPAGGATTGAAAGGFFGAGGLAGAGITTGEVSFANGNTLYVSTSEGNTVKVSAPEGTKVSKTITTNVHSIHPGDTVVVRGSQNKNGSVSASSITISAPGGSGASGAGGSSTSGAGATPQLFGG